MNINSQHPSIHYKGEQLPPFDALIPRIGASNTFYGTAVVRQFEAMGGKVKTGTAVTALKEDRRRVTVQLGAEQLQTLYLIACGGLMNGPAVL